MGTQRLDNSRALQGQPSAIPRRTQARLMRVINVPMRVVLGLPFPTPLSRRLMLVRHIGRRTGRIYRQPVSYVTDGTTLLTPGGGRWTDNLLDGVPIDLRLHGRRVVAHPELVRDVDEVDRLFAVMTAANPRLRRFVPIHHGADGRLDRQQLKAALSHGFCIVRWHLEPAPPQA